MEDENCAQFCPAGLLRSGPAPPPAGERRCPPALGARLQPRRRRAVWVCVPGRSEHRRGSGGGERRPPPRPHPRATVGLARPPCGSGLGVPGVGRRAARSRNLTPHVRDGVGIRTPVSFALHGALPSSGFLRQTPSDPECPSTAREGEEGKVGGTVAGRLQGCGGWDPVMGFPSRLLPRAPRPYSLDFPSSPPPTALFSL